MSDNNFSFFNLLFYIPFGFLFVLTITPSIGTKELLDLFITSIPFGVSFYLFSWFMSIFETAPMHSYYMDQIETTDE